MTRLKDIEALLTFELKKLEEFDVPLKIEAKQVIEDFNNKKISAKDAWYSLPPPCPSGVYHPSIIANQVFGPQRWNYPHTEQNNIRRIYGGIVNPRGDAISVSQELNEWFGKANSNIEHSERGLIRRQIAKKVEELRRQHFHYKKLEEEQERCRNYSPPSFSMDEYIEQKVDERIRERMYGKEW